MAEVKATMAGSIWKITVSIGDTVTKGQEVVILESMKMEIPIEAEQDGKISEILLNEGDFVNDGDTILKITTND